METIVICIHGNSVCEGERCPAYKKCWLTENLNSKVEAESDFNDGYTREVYQRMSENGRAKE